MMDLYDDLVEMLENNDIAYNGTVVTKLARVIEDLHRRGDLANPDPDYADALDIIIWSPANEEDFA